MRVWMRVRGVLVTVLVSGACSRPAVSRPHPCGSWGAEAAEGTAIALSESALRSAVQGDSAALAALASGSTAVRGILRKSRSEPRLFASALKPGRTICIGESGDTVNVNIFFPYPAGRRERTLQNKDAEHLGLVWIRGDPWHLRTWVLWSRF